jgi:uncharacterized protein YecE (DUF72 family)
MSRSRTLAARRRPERERPAASARIGCSGWNYESWRGGLYPRGVPPSRWLELYAQRFDTVEVNSTFYRLPRREAVANWVRHTPSSFTFAVKASRYLTHVRRLRETGPGVRRLYERIEPLRSAGRLGVVLWQLPRNLHRDDELLAGALAHLPAGRHAFEFRHESWFVDPVYALLREHDVALVVGDHPERAFQTTVRTARWSYIRLHYGRRGRRGNYSPTELRQWAETIAAWTRDGDVYAYFNNDWEGFAPRDAAALVQMLERTGADNGRRPSGVRDGGSRRASSRT